MHVLIEVRNIGRFNINLINKNKSSNSLIKLLLSQKFFFIYTSNSLLKLLLFYLKFIFKYNFRIIVF